MDPNQDLSGRPPRRIEVVYLRPSEIGTGFGNPRKPADKKNAEDLRESLDTLGDFGCMVVDENKDIICGNERLKRFIEMGDDEPKLCKQLFGYSRAEKRAINIKGNTHAGTWDTDLLADWTADLNIKIGINEKLEKAAEERSIREMELIHYERYNYVLIACRNELDYNNLVRTLGIEDAKVPICKTRKIKARAIWYDKMKAKLVPIEEKAPPKPKAAGTDWTET
jgi:hypothetical protein